MTIKNFQNQFIFVFSFFFNLANLKKGRLAKTILFKGGGWIYLKQKPRHQIKHNFIAQPHTHFLFLKKTNKIK
jgi:hypothetical protein